MAELKGDSAECYFYIQLGGIFGMRRQQQRGMGETVEMRSSVITVNQVGYQHLPCGIDAVRNHETLPHRTSTSVAPPLHHRYA